MPWHRNDPMNCFEWLNAEGEVIAVVTDRRLVMAPAALYAVWKAAVLTNVSPQAAHEIAARTYLPSLFAGPVFGLPKRYPWHP